MTNPRRLLVVDDEDFIRESLVLGLNDYGWEVCSASSGELALDYDKAFDAYLIDLSLPDHDGLELARRLTDKFGSVPIIILSGFFDAKTEQTACADNVSKFVRKPFKFDELDQILKNLCQRRPDV